jgi:hypothetical protein
VDDDVGIAIDLARAAVGRVAPEELPLFAATSEIYRADPGAVEAETQRDELLGFGGEIAMAITPVALSVAGAVTRFLIEQLREVAGSESQDALHRLLRRVLGTDDGDADAAAAPAPLSKEQLRAVRRVALERARRLALPEAQAELLADAMVGGLVTA